MSDGRWHRLLQQVRVYQDLIVFALLIMLKMLAFQAALGYDSVTPGAVLSTWALLVLVTGWTVLLPFKTRLWTLVGVDVLLTGLLLTDAMFYKNYGNILVLPILGQAGQVGDVLDLVLGQLSWREGLLFADFLFLVPYVIMRGRRNGQGQAREKGRRVLLAGALTALSFSMLAGQLSLLINVHGKDKVMDIYSNNTVLERMGVFNFHAADLYETLAHGEQAVDRNEVQIIRAWMENHRNQVKEPQFYGAAQGKNLIVVQLEAMQGILLGREIGGQEITPNLNKLAKESLSFDNFFPQIGLGVTSDAEFAMGNSLYPLQIGSVYMLKPENSFQSSLPNLLKDMGYRTFAFHGYKPEFYNRNVVYPRLGIDEFYSQDKLEMDEIVGWGLSDESLYRQALEEMKAAEQPFLSIILALSGHTPYKIPEEKKGLQVPEGRFSELFTDYLQAQHYADAAFGQLMDDLEKEGLLDNSVLVVYGDHFGNSLQDGEQVGKFLGMEKFNAHQMMEMRKIPYMIRLPHGEHAGVRSMQAGQIDSMPTLANLLGVERDKMIYMGQDLLNVKAEDGYTAFRHYIGIGSFVTDELFYVLMEKDQGDFAKGICYDRKSGEVLDLKTCEPGYKRAIQEFKMSDRIVNGDLIPQLLEGR